MRRDQQGRGPVSEGVTQGRDLAGEGPRDHRSWAPWQGGPGGLCTRLSCDVEVWLRKTAGCSAGCPRRVCALGAGPRAQAWRFPGQPSPWYLGQGGGRSSPSSTSQRPLQLPHAALGPGVLTLGLPRRALRPPAWEHQTSCGGPRLGAARGCAGSPHAWLAAGGGAAHRCLGAGLTGVPRAAGLGPWSAGHWSTVG